MSEERGASSLLISGTSRGIGRYLAEYYVQQGLRVFGCSRTKVDWSHPQYTHYALDVSDEPAVKAMFSDIRKTAGGLDAVINNAAVNPAIAPALLVPLESLRKTFDINVLGTFLLSREAAKLMMRKRFGRIINLSSMAAYHQVAGEAAYTASKAAVTALSRVLAKELAGQGITCNVLAPSAIPTELSAAVNPAALSEVLRRNAIPEMGTMADVSNAIDWLLKPESQAITGQVIYLGGV